MSETKIIETTDELGGPTHALTPVQALMNGFASGDRQQLEQALNTLGVQIERAP